MEVALRKGGGSSGDAKKAEERKIILLDFS